jgi:hypothetical protein
MDGGIAACNRGSCALMIDGLDDVGARLLEDDQKHAPLAGRPRGLLGVLRTGDGLSYIAHAQRRPLR